MIQKQYNKLILLEILSGNLVQQISFTEVESTRMYFIVKELK